MFLDVHQCSRCELRFSNVAELQDHFARDHHADPETFDRLRYPSRHPATAPARRCLVVANQTLHDDQLIDAIKERAAAADTAFVVLVPATHSSNLETVSPAATVPDAADDHTDDSGLAQARWRVRTTLERLHDAGIDAEARIGHPEPYVAISQMLREQPFDEVVVSTLPRGVSRWLHADLPTRLRRHFHVPVTVVTPHS